MNIRFLRAWLGYQPNQCTELVGAGMAKELIHRGIAEEVTTTQKMVKAAPRNKSMRTVEVKG